MIGQDSDPVADRDVQNHLWPALRIVSGLLQADYAL